MTDVTETYSVSSPRNTWRLLHRFLPLVRDLLCWLGYEVGVLVGCRETWHEAPR